MNKNDILMNFQLENNFTLLYIRIINYPVTDI